MFAIYRNVWAGHYCNVEIIFIISTSYVSLPRAKYSTQTMYVMKNDQVIFFSLVKNVSTDFINPHQQWFPTQVRLSTKTNENSKKC